MVNVVEPSKDFCVYFIWSLSWNKTHYLHELQGLTCMKCAQTTGTCLQAHTFTLRKMCISPRMLQLLFNLLLSSSSLNLHSTRRDKAKNGMDIIKAFMATVQHLKYHLKRSLVFQRDWQWFSASHLLWSLKFFIFFLPFLYFILSVWEQGRWGGSVLKGKSSLLCGRSHRLRLADEMTGQSRYPERVPYHGNCSNFAHSVSSHLRVQRGVTVERWVSEVSTFLSNHTADRVNTKLCRVWNPDRVKLPNLSLGEEKVMFYPKDSEANLSQPRKLIQPRPPPHRYQYGRQWFLKLSKLSKTLLQWAVVTRLVLCVNCNVADTLFGRALWVWASVECW